MENLEWLDRHIEQQKINTEIMQAVCSPYDPAELQEIIERGFVDNC